MDRWLAAESPKHVDDEDGYQASPSQSVEDSSEEVDWDAGISGRVASAAKVYDLRKVTAGEKP